MGIIFNPSLPWGALFASLRAAAFMEKTFINIMTKESYKR
jgi:hypothetical protein